MPRYLVVMPARNAADTIGRAIASIADQLPADSRIAVWDDESSDNTAEIALKHGRGLVDIYGNGKSVGGGGARRELLARTDSKYIINMDADDISMPWRLRAQLPHLTGTQLCFGSTMRFGPGWPPKLKLTSPLPYNSEDLRFSLAFHNMLSHPTLVGNRKTLMDAGSYSESPVAQDYELWLRAVSRGLPLIRVSVPVLAYRLSPGQVSKQNGYVERILGQPSFVEAFAEYLRSLRLGVEVEASDLEDLRLRTHDVLPILVSRMRPHLRPKYRGLLRTRPFGALIKPSADEGVSR